MDNCEYYNAVEIFVDANVEKGLGDKAAFVDGDRTLSYGDLQIATCQVANLLTSLDVRREERVGVLLFDTVDFPVCYWGAIRAGIVPVCLNTLLTTDQYEYLMSDSRIRTLFISPQLLDVVSPILAGLENLKSVIVVGQGQEDHEYLVFETLLRKADKEFSTAKTSADEVAFWLYSSGTTGNPKGVCHVHSSLEYVARNLGQAVLKITRDDVVFSAAKLFFAYAQGGILGNAMFAGATSILLTGRPTPEAIMATLKHHQPTLFQGVPTLYANILASPVCQRESMPKNLRLCISAGEALPEDVGRSWKKKMGIDVIDTVGSTEMLNAFIANRPDDIRYGASGRAIDGYRLKLTDEDGNNTPVGEIGELLVSGGSAAQGYWNQREKSRHTFLGEWVRTGDKYFRDKEGYYHYCGRSDDMFKVGGRWVSPFEVEQALISHPAVVEAAVVAWRDSEGLIKPKAFVVLGKGVAQDGLFAILKEHVKASVGPWKYPRRMEFMAELPKTATGKTLRYKLRGT